MFELMRRRRRRRVRPSLLPLIFCVVGSAVVDVTDDDAALSCVDESPGYKFTFANKGNASCFGLCYSSATARQYGNRTGDFSCEAAAYIEGRPHEVCENCYNSCDQVCSPTAFPTSIPTAAPSEIPTSMPSNVPTAVPTSVPTSVPTTFRKLFITEIADPSNDVDARFVELYSPTGGSLDGLKLVRTRKYTKYTASVVLELSGQTLVVGGFLIVCADKVNYDDVYADTCDVDAGDGGPAEFYGDDSFAILDAADETIDVFGVPGVDGAGTSFDFTDGRVERNIGAFVGSDTAVIGDWAVTSGGVLAPGGYDPRVWVGE